MVPFIVSSISNNLAVLFSQALCQVRQIGTRLSAAVLVVLELLLGPGSHPLLPVHLPITLTGPGYSRQRWKKLAAAAVPHVLIFHSCANFWFYTQFLDALASLVLMMVTDGLTD